MEGLRAWRHGHGHSSSPDRRTPERVLDPPLHVAADSPQSNAPAEAPEADVTGLGPQTHVIADTSQSHVASEAPQQPDSHKRPAQRTQQEQPIQTDGSPAPLLADAPGQHQPSDYTESLGPPGRVHTADDAAALQRSLPLQALGQHLQLQLRQQQRQQAAKQLGRRQFHTIMTANGALYVQWQVRLS